MKKKILLDICVWVGVIAIIAIVLWAIRMPAEFDSPEYRTQIKKHATGPTIEEFFVIKGYNPADFVE